MIPRNILLSLVISGESPSNFCVSLLETWSVAFDVKNTPVC
jgi:hypothetical protein